MVLLSDLGKSEVDIGVGGHVLHLVGVDLGGELSEKLVRVLDAKLGQEVAQVLDVLLSLGLGHGLSEGVVLVVLKLDAGLGELKFGLTVGVGVELATGVNFGFRIYL